MSHPHVFRVTRATHFVARQGTEPQTIRLRGECFNHCATDLAMEREGERERKFSFQRDFTHDVTPMVRTWEVTGDSTAGA